MLDLGLRTSFLYIENVDLRQEVFGVLSEYLQNPDSHATVSMNLALKILLVYVKKS